MTHRILVLGSSNLDLILKIPRFPNPGETLIGENLVTVFGGKGANQALAAKRLGGKVALITKLGRDPYGECYRRYLPSPQPGWAPSLPFPPKGIFIDFVLPFLSPGSWLTRRERNLGNIQYHGDRGVKAVDRH